VNPVAPQTLCLVRFLLPPPLSEKPSHHRTRNSERTKDRSLFHPAPKNTPPRPGTIGAVPVQAASGRRRGAITREGKRRLLLAMKKRWAERRKKRS